MLSHGHRHRREQKHTAQRPFCKRLSINPGTGLLGWLQNRCVAFIAGDNAIELLELFGLANGHAQLLNLKGARIANDVSFYFGSRVVAREAEIGIHGRRQFVHFVAFWYCNFKVVRVLHWTVEFDWELSRLLGLQYASRFSSNHSWP